MNSNYEQALKWYGKAADMGNAEAQCNMGKILDNMGRILIEDGKKYLRLSAKQGNKEAAALLGTMLSADSIHVPKIVASKINAESAGTGDCLVFESREPFSIKAEKRWDGIIEYSLDRLKWQKWDGKKITSKNNVIYMRGYGNTVITGDGKAKAMSWCFEGAAALICRGNIEVLLDYRLVCRGKHPKMKANCYRSMFYNCKSLEEAPELPATELAERCYFYMFNGCTSLQEAPALPATELASYCYYAMFARCTSLKEAPKLPATELPLECYSYMFLGCTSLEKAPKLSATKLSKYDCFMFDGTRFELR